MSHYTIARSKAVSGPGARNNAVTTLMLDFPKISPNLLEKYIFWMNGFAKLEITGKRDIISDIYGCVDI